ncbi:MAG: hypothetical protein ACPGO3_12080 [Magnetospiraceae bacterium]
MGTEKAASLTGALLARKGEAKPAARSTAFTNPSLANPSAKDRPDGNWYKQPRAESTPAPETVTPPEPAIPEDSERVTPPPLIDVRQTLAKAKATHGPTRRAPVGPRTSMKENQGKRTAITVRLADEEYLRLKIYTARSRRTIQDVMMEALDAYLDGRIATNCPSGCKFK